MSSDLLTLCERADRTSAAALENLAVIETALRDLQGEVAKLPVFVRGFVSAQVKGGTGQDIPAWLQTASTLSATIREAQEAVGRVRGTGTVSDADRSICVQASQRVQAERPRLDALLDFMQKAPSKLSSVPNAMLPAGRRGDLAGAIERQTQALQGVLTAVPDLADSLNALGGKAE